MAGMRRSSIWTVDAGLPQFRSLDTDTQADVCVVGAGIAGLSVAYMLTQIGKTVVVIDDGEIGNGMTGVTTAHLTCMLDRRYVEIERIHGAHYARIAARSHEAAINRIETIVANEGIDCGFERVPGFLFRAPGDESGVLDDELAALRRAGLNEAALIERAPLPDFDTGPCIVIPSQAQFHPLRYLAALARAVRREGGEIYTGTKASTIDGGDAPRVQAGRHAIISDAVVVATNAPINDLVAIHTKQAPYMSYVIAARIAPGSVPRGLYWDTLDDYHYVRLQARCGGREYLIVGGEDHKSGQADDTAERPARLESWARERFPSMDAIEAVWAGQVMESIDGLAFIGKNPLDKDNVYVVTGDSGTGMTHGTIAGILLSDLILGRRNPWQKIYDPARKPVRAAGTFLKENGQHGRAVRRLAEAGRGRLRRGNRPQQRRAGARRTPEDRRLPRRATARCTRCPRSATTSAASSTGTRAETSWDCPCHGSRFDRFGKVFNGPANRDLESLTPSKMRTG